MREDTYPVPVAVQGKEFSSLRSAQLAKPTKSELSTRVNEHWSMDFISDQLANGRRFRILNIVDGFSHECVLQVVDFLIFQAALGA
jgi:putative transposase